MSIQRQLITYQDSIDHMVDHMGGNANADELRIIKRAVDMAYHQLLSEHRWRCLLQRYRVSGVAEYSTGTIEYDHTGGSSERLVTLTSGTVPTWIEYARVEIDGVSYFVDTYLSTSTFTLHEDFNPGEDVAAGTSWSAKREIYTLPEDFQELDYTRNDNNFTYGTFVDVSSIYTMSQYGDATGDPYMHSVFSDPKIPGRSALWLYPAPDADAEIDFIYKRLIGKGLYYTGTESTATGTASMTAGSKTVTGSGTTFTEDMVGSVFRLASDTTTPTSRYGSNPFAHEGTIRSVASTTSLTLDEAPSSSLSSKSFQISSHILLSENMIQAWWRCLELQLAITRITEREGVALALYRQAVLHARATEPRSYGVRHSADDSGMFWRDLSDWTYTEES